MLDQCGAFRKVTPFEFQSLRLTLCYGALGRERELVKVQGNVGNDEILCVYTLGIMEYGREHKTAATHQPEENFFRALARYLEGKSYEII